MICPKCKSTTAPGEPCKFCGLVRTGRNIPRLEQPDVTALERVTVKALRNEAGWWEGDDNAIRVLREYAKAFQMQIL